LLFSFFSGNQSSLETINTLDNAFDFLSSDVSKTLLWSISEGFNTNIDQLRPILRYEFLMIYKIWMCNALYERCNLVQINTRYSYATLFALFISFGFLFLEDIKYQVKTARVTKDVDNSEEDARYTLSDSRYCIDSGKSFLGLYHTI